MVPIIALLIGGWMLYDNFKSKGPVARVGFETADGIAANKTDVRCRSVKVGIVKSVKLTDDMNSVVVSLELDPDSSRLLRSGTHFWVVRPRVSTTDISGLGTLLTGAYIELDPGPETGKEVNDFKGLETPPATNRNIPGRRLTLTAEEAGSLAAGSPIYYRGLEVGRIESRKLDADGKTVTYDAFIREEYSMLVKENTRFWNTSGIDISAGADGFKVRTPSLQAMVAGGATFGVPEGLIPGKPAMDGMTYTLFSDEDAATGSAFNPTMKFLLLFDQTVRGLSRSAPVEFRGIVIGRVADISLNYMKDPADSRIPVVIEIDPSLLRRESAEKILTPDSDFLKLLVKQGLRASLKPGSLLTGALFVDLDYYKDASPAELAKVGDLTTLPTVSSGLVELQAKVTAMLDRIQSLPLEAMVQKYSAVADQATSTIAEAGPVLAEIKETAAAARKTLDNPEFKKLPADLRGTLVQLDKSVSSMGPDGAIQGDLLRTLEELRSALRTLNSVATTVDEKPNSLLFGRDSSGNPVPKAPSGKR